MQWLAANWFWVLIFIGFIAMHVFGHGGHGGRPRHGRRGHQQSDDEKANEVPERGAEITGHQH